LKERILELHGFKNKKPRPITGDRGVFAAAVSFTQDVEHMIFFSKKIIM
jgi:hypothetical protein